MSIKNIQALLAELAERVKNALAGGELASWRVMPEAGNDVPPVGSPAEDVPRVVLQADAGQYALPGSLHRCFRYECDAVVVFTPSVDNARAFPGLLAQLSAALRDVLAASAGPIRTADGVVGCYVVQAALASCTTELAENSYHFRQSFRLVVQF